MHRRARRREPVVASAAVTGRVFSDVEIRTARLLLRAPREADLDDEVTACQDELTQRWLPLPHPYRREDAEAFSLVAATRRRIEGAGLLRAIEVEGRYAGTIDLKRADWSAGSVEVGYLTAPWARGRGVMTEALSALTTWVLDQGFGRVEVRAAVGNLASQRVAERAGFRREGVLRRAGYTHDGPVDILVLSRTCDDPPVETAKSDPASGRPSAIRPSALVGIRRGPDLLVVQAREPSGLAFLRLPGGGIEAGELAVQAAVREIREELGATLLDPSLRGVVENLWRDAGGRQWHELCFIVAGSLAGSSTAAADWSGLIADTGQPVSWVPLAECRAGPLPFHPAPALDLLMDHHPRHTGRVDGGLE